MADIKTYRQCIEDLLKKYVRLRSNGNNSVEAQIVVDRERDHYQLIYIGWRGDRRIFGPVLHFDLKDDKIWIQWNGTEEDVASELVNMGVPQEDIVIGFHPPYMRRYTEYGVG